MCRRNMHMHVWLCVQGNAPLLAEIENLKAQVAAGQTEREQAEATRQQYDDVVSQWQV